jgi:3-deoxy-manno-octulosonate cytidylyltransferase (CMP-KDO synthetase)
MRVLIVIPARYDSSRFPGKMLASTTGRPLIQHVHERAQRARCADGCVVATDDERIAAAVRAFGGIAVMTRRDHPNGTARIAEAVEALERRNPADRFDMIVNVQGDEPELDPALIDLAVEALGSADDCPVATVASPFAAHEDPANPNIVKVVLDTCGRALYFSRALIPHDRDGGAAVRPLKHVGLYVYRRPFLHEYISLSPTPLEQAERLEQLRILEHGRRIAVAVAPEGAHHHGIDTPEQYEAFVRRHRP